MQTVPDSNEEKNDKLKKKRCKPGRRIVLAFLIAAVIGFGIQLLWNWGLGPLMGGAPIAYWTSIAIGVGLVVMIGVICRLRSSVGTGRSFCRCCGSRPKPV